MPTTSKNIGTLTTHIGAIKENKLRILAYIKDCDKEKCPLKDICHYKPKGKCSVLNNFINSLYTEWTDPINGIGDILDQMQLNRIGIHLIPLYHMLMRFSIEADLREGTEYTSFKTGQKYTYPQFKEIRETIKAINAEMKEIGLEALWRQKFGDNRKMPGPKPIRDYLDEKKYGQRGGYDEATKDKSVAP